MAQPPGIPGADVFLGYIAPMRKFLLTLMALAVGAVAQTQDVRALVQKLYPGEGRRLMKQHAPEIFTAMGVKEGSTVADVGSGDGDWSLVLSYVVGSAGRVYAEDIDAKGAITPLKKRMKKEHRNNVVAILGTAEDPKLPALAVDSVLVVGAYHEFVKYQPMLARIREALKPDGRLVMVERWPQRTINRSREAQCQNHVIAPAIVDKELRAAGFADIELREDLDRDPDQESVYWMMTARVR